MTLSRALATYTIADETSREYWVDLFRVAVKHSPTETRTILKYLVECEEQKVQALKEVLARLSS